jgi:SNF2 family DNA or RNA helicase
MHDYQEDARRWARARTEGLLWIDLGLGKTVIMATALADIFRIYPQINQALVVGTKNIVTMTWPDELAEWEHLQHFSYQVAAGSKKVRDAAVLARPDILGVNYENLVWLLNTYGSTDLIPDVLVLDEISRLKDHSTKRFKALRGFVPRFARRFGLTATPAAEHYTGLWAQHASISPRPRLGNNITQFRNAYCSEKLVGGTNRKYDVTEAGKEAIINKLAPITLRQDAADYQTLAEPMEIDIKVPWEIEERAAYVQMEKEFKLELEDVKRIEAVNAGVVYNKLRQMCGGCIYDEDGNPVGLSTTKLDACVEAYEALQGDPTLIFYQYKWEREELLKRVEGAQTLDVKGTLDRWNAGEIPALILHPASAGHGLNLQKPCRNLMWYALPWSLEQYLQANGRVQRQGQERPVRIYRLLRYLSLDEDVLLKLQGKLSGQDDLLLRVKQRNQEVFNNVAA